MIQRILNAISAHYIKVELEPNYILMSEDLYQQLTHELEPRKRFTGFGTRESSAVSIFHGLKIVIVQGTNRLEIA